MTNESQDAAEESSGTIEYTTVPTLQLGVPFYSPPTGVERPSLPWLIQFVRVISAAAVNRVATARNINQADEQQGTGLTSERLKQLGDAISSAVLAARGSKDTDTIGEAPVDAPEAGGPAIPMEDIQAELTQAFCQTARLFATAGATEPISPAETAASITDYQELFKTIPLPAIAETFDTDEAFSKMRVAGFNPMSIFCVTKAELIKMIGDRISDADFNATLGTAGDSVIKAGEDGRLCVVNYKELSTTNRNLPGGVTFVTNPIAVFAEPLYESDFIKPVAIQLGQDPVESEIVMANTTDIYRWKIAKNILQAADGTYHSVVEHLAYTHLVMEAFSVATQRNFTEDHPLGKLLMPHIEGTNFINQLAGVQLVDSGGPISQVFCANDEPRLISIRGMTVNSRTTFDFKSRMPDVELKRRGVDKLKVFPYRDDALLIWGAILNWAEDYVGLYYTDDDAVKNDEQLTSWARDLEDNAILANFTPPENKADLVRTLAMFMFLASAQHACMNFPQLEYLTFAPNMPGCVWSNYPKDVPVTEEQYLKSLPPIPSAAFQLFLFYTLGGVYHRKLGEYQSNKFPYRGTLERKAQEALNKFNEALKAIETKINEANVKRGYMAYEFLLPSKIPPSINI